MASRICVKNLPAHLDEARLKDHFSAKGVVSDVRIIKTKDGRSRRFGFVGYLSEREATEALNYFNNTFIDTTRIKVEPAKPKDSGELERPWSRYSKGSSSYEKKLQRKEKTILERTTGERKEDKAKLSEEGNAPEPTDGKNQKLDDFLAMMQTRSQSKFWANDDGPESRQNSSNSAASKAQGQGEAETGDASEVTDGESAEEEDGDEESTENKKNQEAFDSTLSDLDYLRSKVSKTIDEESEGDVGVVDGAAAEAMAAAESGKSAEKDTSEVRAGKVKGLETLDETRGPSKKEEEEEEEDQEEDDMDNPRLFVRNLPFIATEEDLEKYFGKIGEVTEVHLPSDEMKRKKGFGFVTYLFPEHAHRAMEELDGKVFQGRIIHVLKAKQAKAADEGNADSKSGGSSSYKKEQEEKRQKNAGDKRGWNASFIRGDAVVDVMADRLNLEKGDILDREGKDLAVRLALGETHLIQENMKFFKEKGVNLEALEGHGDGSKTHRSKTTLLVKNLPYSTVESELEKMFSKFGEIFRFILSPSKTLAIVEFGEALEARKAFRGLAYKKYQHAPLYIEWAPIDTFRTEASKDKTSREATKEDQKEVPSVAEEDDSVEIPYCLFVKNLNFETTEDSLKNLFSKAGTVRTVSIAKKRNPKAKGGESSMLSMGYGFVEFPSENEAKKALKSMQGSRLDGHALELKLSQKKLSKVSSKEKAKHGRDGLSTKIIVRNIAFEANRKDVRALFASFGQVKSIRMPKKFDGSHRGFAFVEFVTEQEAKDAVNALSKTHLYGRHLVIEKAKGEEGLDQLRQKAAQDMMESGGPRKKMRLEEDEFEKDPFADM